MSREATVVPRKHITYGLLANELLFEQKAQKLGAEESSEKFTSGSDEDDGAR